MRPATWDTGLPACHLCKSCSEAVQVSAVPPAYSASVPATATWCTSHLPAYLCLCTACLLFLPLFTSTACLGVLVPAGLLPCQTPPACLPLGCLEPGDTFWDNMGSWTCHWACKPLCLHLCLLPFWERLGDCTNYLPLDTAFILYRCHWKNATATLSPEGLLSYSPTLSCGTVPSFSPHTTCCCTAAQNRTPFLGALIALHRTTTGRDSTVSCGLGLPPPPPPYHSLMPHLEDIGGVRLGLLPATLCHDFPLDSTCVSP